MAILIAVRVDSSTAIGLGHVQRCLALARAVEDAGGQVLFVTRSLDVDGPERIERAGFEVRRLPSATASRVEDPAPPHAAWAGLPWSEDAEQTCKVLRDRRPDWLVVDHYSFDARWHSRVAHSLGCRIAVIDDLADRPLQCDLLVDQNLSDDHRQKYLGQLSKSTTLLGGPRFALLGPSYAGAPRYVASPTVRTIGIFMGGSDSAGLSAQALRGCREIAHFHGPIEVATTRANPHLGDLTAEVGHWAPACLSVDLSDLSEFFARHDLQIGAGGGASWERCCIGVPALAVVAAPNQQFVVDGLAARGAVATLKSGESPNAKTIGLAVAALIADTRRRLELADRARGLVDGMGAIRVALAVLSSTLRLRPATIDDTELVYRWRNHASVRAVSRNREPIETETHQRWISQVIEDSRRHLFIGVVGRRPVGVLRLDDDEDAQCTEVSLFLDPALHGLGLGSLMLRACEEECRPRARGWRLTATVLANNSVSRRLFEAAGYRFDGEQGEKLLDPETSQEIRAS